MRREDFEHVVAASANVVGEAEFVIVGSQAIMGSHPNAPDALLMSLELGIYPAASPERADMIDGALGDGSPFHRAFGYYAHGVGPETAPHDVVLAKCVAGRERDWEFARAALAAGLVEPRVLVARVEDLPIAPDARVRLRRMLEQRDRP